MTNHRASSSSLINSGNHNRSNSSLSDRPKTTEVKELLDEVSKSTSDVGSLLTSIHTLGRTEKKRAGYSLHRNTDNGVTNNEFHAKQKSPRYQQTTFKLNIDKRPVQKLYLRKNRDSDATKKKEIQSFTPLGAIIFASNNIFKEQLPKEEKKDDYSKYREEYDERNFLSLKKVRERLKETTKASSNTVDDDEDRLINVGSFLFNDLNGKTEDVSPRNLVTRAGTAQLSPKSKASARQRPTPYILPYNNQLSEPILPNISPSSARKISDEGDLFLKEMKLLERNHKQRVASSRASRRSASATMVSRPSTATSTKPNTERIDQEAELLTVRSTIGGRDRPTTSQLLEEIMNEDLEAEEEEDDMVPMDIQLTAQEPLKLQYDPTQIQLHSASLPRNANKGTSLKDFLIMAEACNRAGKNRMEGLTHYKLALKFQESNDHAKAIRHLKKFLLVSRALNDETGVCLALNCLGVIHQKAGGRQNLETALDFHMQHWEMADDQGRVVAHINIGLIYQSLGEKEQATENYSSAYSYAKRIGDKHGESIALANLGILGKDQGDYENAQVLMEKHLELSETLKDGKSSSDAYKQLGLLAEQRGDSEAALQFFSKARIMAIQQEDQTKANQLKCNIGVVSGNAAFEKLIENIAQSYINSTDDP